MVQRKPLKIRLFRWWQRKITVDIVVVSMLELGFAEDELATLDTIYNRAKQMGLETCPVETAAQLRLQFLDQPDWRTGERLSDFFVASEPFVLTPDGFPKIFSVVRDDRTRTVKPVSVYGWFQMVPLMPE